MKKKHYLIAMALCFSIVLGIFAPSMVCAEEAEEAVDPRFEEHLTFTVLSLDDNENYMEFPLVKEAREKFNFDFEIQQVAWDSWDQNVRTLAATGSLPEVIGWYNLNHAEYMTWARQGVFRAFPQDLSAYPNLEEIRDNTTIFDFLDVDGELYAFPKVINSNPYNKFDPYFIVYRRDWAEAVGKDFAPVQDLSWDEFVEYLELLKEEDPGNLGDSHIPFELVNGGQSWIDIVRRFFAPHIYGVYATEDGYLWGPGDEASFEGITQVKDLYDRGLLARDSYTDKASMGKERFYAGRSGVYFSNYNIATLRETVNALAEVTPEFTEEDLGILTVRGLDDYYYVTQKSEWWAAFAFNNTARDEVVDRWLAVGDWLLEDEQVEKYAYGVPGEDWEKSEDGEITLHYTPEETASGNEKSYITDQKTFQKLFILEGLDVWLPNNPAYSDYLVNDLFETALLQFEENPYFSPSDYFQGFTSTPAKDQYLGILVDNTKNAVVQTIVAENAEENWNTFLEQNRSMADQIIEELDAALEEAGDVPLATDQIGSEEVAATS